MKTTLFFASLFCMAFGLQLHAQTLKVGFGTDKIDVTRTKKDVYVPLTLKMESPETTKEVLEQYQVEIKVDESNTDILPSGYQLYFEKADLSSLGKGHEILLRITGDSIADRQRRLMLQIKVSPKDSSAQALTNTAEHQKLEILLNSYQEALDGYKYLAYVGTNFDLVEGIRAKDLFFATNVYDRPKAGDNGNVGFYLSLYGNRAFTQTDSSGTIRREVRFEALTDTTSQRITISDYYANKWVTDNIGAHISPLIKLGLFRSNHPDRKIDFYYAPSIEFVYRRTTLSFIDLERETRDTMALDLSREEAILDYTGGKSTTINPPPPLYTRVYNEYAFNLGILGVFLSLENEKISVRVHGSIGYASNYDRVLEEGLRTSEIRQRSDIFFSGRAWVTDAKSGITLQAEVTNSAINPRPFFVATLSKAFNFKKIGEFFQPIVQ
ncbi:hypothetical protein EZV76_12865 [Flagellimonas alvinocaridis]|uniref:DUF4861 domain-containing protein n=1 Tax=Flagellimonas alvinocaridis TaxID=2530200 RepID=A0A4S8RML6_9FLAO|nr:hypothetical protein [Allomuricauda alvinocaridis]THV58165.1 hypothetical protein EZV76_12865 [Allomuricauda alvinocaridis]